MDEFDRKLEELVIKIGCGGFVGEHNMVYRPALEYFKKELNLLFDEREYLLKQAKQDSSKQG